MGMTGKHKHKSHKTSHKTHKSDKADKEDLKEGKGSRKNQHKREDREGYVEPFALFPCFKMCFVCIVQKKNNQFSDHTTVQ